MATTFEQDTATPALLVHLRPVFEMTDEQFEELCRINRDLGIEMTAEGDLIIMPPTFGRTGNRNGCVAKIILRRESSSSGFHYAAI